MWAALIPVWNWFSGIGTFFKENKWAQYALGAFIAFLAFKKYESDQAKKYTEIGRRQVEDEVRVEQKKRAEEGREVLELKIEAIKNEPVIERKPVEVIEPERDIVPDSSELFKQDPERASKLFE